MKRDYEVGYRKPPKATQFKPGQSGNLAGPKRKLVHQPAGAVDLEILKIGDEKVRVKQNGKEIVMPAHQAVRRSQAQQGMQGKRLQANKFIDDYDAAKAFVEQETADRYAFWSDWRGRYEAEPLNWPVSDRRAPLLPHPRDILIDPTTREVTFVGPIDLEELLRYSASVVLAELLLVQAEQMLRDNGQTDLVCALQRVALLAYGLSPPSFGGQAADELQRDMLHRFTALFMETGSQTSCELTRRRTALELMFDRAVYDPVTIRQRNTKTGLKSLASLAGGRRSAKSVHRR